MTEVSSEDYARILDLLEQARKVNQRSKSHKLTLEQRVALMREAKRLHNEALAIGQVKP